MQYLGITGNGLGLDENQSVLRSALPELVPALRGKLALVQSDNH